MFQLEIIIFFGTLKKNSVYLEICYTNKRVETFHQIKTQSNKFNILVVITWSSFLILRYQLTQE